MIILAKSRDTRDGGAGCVGIVCNAAVRGSSDAVCVGAAAAASASLALSDGAFSGGADGRDRRAAAAGRAGGEGGRRNGRII